MSLQLRIFLELLQGRLPGLLLYVYQLRRLHHFRASLLGSRMVARG